MTLSVIGLGIYSFDKIFNKSVEVKTQELSEGKVPENVPKEKESSVELENKEEKQPEKVAAMETQVAVHFQKAWKNFSYTEELSVYEKINRKVILSAEDKSQKKQLMANENFLRGLEDILKAAPMNEKTRLMQNTALDFVVDALNSDMKSAAVQVLKTIVKDPSVEDSSLSKAQRQSLAGVKAEALFYLTANDPKASAEVPALLPGSVSEKIWENIQRQQANNLAESQSLAGSR